MSPAAPAVATRPTPSQTLAASAAGSAGTVISCRLRAAPPRAWGTPMRDAAAPPGTRTDGDGVPDGVPSGPTAGWPAAGASAPSAPPASVAATPDGAVPAAGCPAPGCWSGVAVPAGRGGVAVAGVADPVAAAPAAGAGAGEFGTVVIGTGVVGDGETVVASGTAVGCGAVGAASPSRPCSSPPIAGSCVLPVICTSGSPEPEPPSACDAGTPAERTSTAPIAAAALPRRTPPWIPVREREISDL